MQHRILLVDDLKSIRNVISTTLAERGCLIDYKDSGLEGLEAAKENKYDLIILDIHLPDMSGIMICNTLKQTAYYKNRPIVLLTSDHSQLEQGLKAGASDYILKPFREVELIARIFTQLNLSKEHLKSIEDKENIEHCLNEERGKTERAQLELSEYFYQSVHRLRSPLTSMEGLVQLMQMQHPEMINSEYLPLIKKNLEKLYYVNKQVAKIGELKAHIVTEKRFKISSCLQNLIKNEYQDYDINLKLEDNLVIKTDPYYLHEGLTPIIDNALFFNGLRKHGEKVKIALLSEAEKTFIKITDYGPGIPKEYMNKVFDMFFIGNDESRGNGMGLFISKLALSSLNIDIIIDSASNLSTSVLIDVTNILDN